MPYIKEIVMHGFKSFARETKIPFRNTMNVVVGPNGSGKSNITDAICFVLGRRGSKSMRAKRLGNLLFAGTQKYKPASEASVEMIFDNTDKGFAIDAPEINIERILRKNGQGIYKINNEVKTLQEVLELLCQAGIDPNGFNIVLQGEIDSFVKMPSESRREVIEEVAGISIYERRKEHSLKELEKTEERLKEVNAVIRERTAYLRNLEEERKTALRFKKLQEEIKNFKASLLHRTSQDKQEQIDNINNQITKQQQEISKINSFIERNNQEISILNEKIIHITEDIQKESGLQQEKINAEISDLRADIEGFLTRKQIAENRVLELNSRKAEIEIAIKRLANEIDELRKSKGSTKSSDNKKELQEKKKQLEEIDEKKRKFYMLKANLSSLDSKLEDKKRQAQKIRNDSGFTFERIKEMEAGIKIKDSLENHQDSVAKLKMTFDKIKREISELQQVKNEKEKQAAILRMQINELDKVKKHVSSFDICPLCKTKMTKEHVGKVIGEAEEQQKKHSQEAEHSEKLSKESEEKITELAKSVEKAELELKVRSQDILRLELINEKKETLRKLSEEQKQFEKEQSEFENKKELLEKQIISVRTSEENYDSLRLEIQELERREEKSVGMDVTLKQREAERMQNIIRQAIREIEEENSELGEISNQLELKQNILDDKNDQDQMLKQKFKKILDEKTAHQEKIRFFESDTLHKQNAKNLLEQRINDLKIQRAQLAAQKESAEKEQAEFKEAKIMRLPIEVLQKRLEETQRTVDSIGSVNLRSLEVYENVKKEYEKIQEKSNILLSEKQEILKVIEDIDKKKKKVFVQTLNDINTLFSRNFSQLSTKGIASLQPTNEEDLFAGGIEMLIKVGKGKYFDTNSLSGGEKSLISLALIFAIQEYKPYCFYIFDEIDAALDRRNSERLAALLKHYINKRQYIIITHNDSLITEAPIIYGVSMQDKISHVVSLEV